MHLLFCFQFCPAQKEPPSAISKYSTSDKQCQLSRQHSAISTENSPIFWNHCPYKIGRFFTARGSLSQLPHRKNGVWRVESGDVVSPMDRNFHLIRHPACGERRMPPSPQGEGFSAVRIRRGMDFFLVHAAGRFVKRPYVHSSLLTPNSSLLTPLSTLHTPFFLCGNCDKLPRAVKNRPILYGQ